MVIRIRISGARTDSGIVSPCSGRPQVLELAGLKARQGPVAFVLGPWSKVPCKEIIGGLFARDFGPRAKDRGGREQLPPAQELADERLGRLGQEAQPVVRLLEALK